MTGLTTKQMQRMGLSRRQAVKLHKQYAEVTDAEVKKEIEKNGKWARKIVPSQHAIKHSVGAAKF